GVSLTVEHGSVVALLGPNGAGKTTTVEIIEGYRAADAGTIRVLGMDPVRGGPPLRARLGLMLQEGGFDIRARPLETLQQYAAFHADPRNPDELLELVGLRAVAATPYRRLSGGERQRLALAVALVGRPEVAILDEPTAGMDPEARAATRELVHGLRADGVAILMTSHDLTDVERLADRICILRAGRVVAAGTVAELTAGLRPRLRIHLDRALEATERSALGDTVRGDVLELEPGRYEITGPDLSPTPTLVAAVTAWCAGADRLVLESRTVGGSLEEAYLDLVGGPVQAEPSGVDG
ncbi:MAG TPA: ABC transporter ATP-binding protein, partial [Candidatus Saccharimonadales bacterium]|nr:ABC transporter ATP-binding protein [Candidatus Saccharimonadales bacterium]